MIDEHTPVLVQGITGREGSFHTRLMLDYGTQVVAGVTPGRGGQSVAAVPVYDTVREALDRHPGVRLSVSFVPAPSSLSALMEAVDAGIPWVVAITEGIPVRDSLWLVNYARCRGSRILGPNTPGVIAPGKAKAGIMPASAFAQGSAGLVSRSGTMTYEVASAMKSRGQGVSLAVGVGGDAVLGTSLLEAALIMEADPATDVIVVLGEIGGGMEEELASAVANGTIKKPVVAYIAGHSAPHGKRMGHAGAILSVYGGSAQEKARAMREAGALVAETPWDIPDMLEGLRI